MGSLECSHLCSILKNEVAFRLARGVPEVRSVYNEGTNEGILRTELITRPPPFLQRASKTAMEFSFPLGEAERRRPTKMGIADAWLIAMSPCLCPPKQQERLGHRLKALAVLVHHRQEVSPGMELPRLLPL